MTYNSVNNIFKDIILPLIQTSLSPNAVTSLGQRANALWDCLLWLAVVYMTFTCRCYWYDVSELIFFSLLRWNRGSNKSQYFKQQGGKERKGRMRQLVRCWDTYLHYFQFFASAFKSVLGRKYADSVLYCCSFTLRSTEAKFSQTNSMCWMSQSHRVSLGSLKCFSRCPLSIYLFLNESFSSEAIHCQERFIF